MCTMGVSSSSCGSLEAIVPVGVPNTALLATRRDALTSTTWSIFCTPCCLKNCLRCRIVQVEHPIFIATAFIIIPACKCHVCVNFAEFKAYKKIKKTEKKIYQHPFLTDNKVYKIRLKGLKKYRNIPLVHVWIQKLLSAVVLQNAFLGVKICFIGHIIVPRIYVSHLTFSVFFNDT